MIDGLDTAMLMGLDDVVEEIVDHVETVNFDKDWKASTFEFTLFRFTFPCIRNLFIWFASFFGFALFWFTLPRRRCLFVFDLLVWLPTEGGPGTSRSCRLVFLFLWRFWLALNRCMRLGL